MLFHEVVAQINELLTSYRTRKITKSTLLTNSRICLNNFYHVNNEINKSRINITNALLEGQQRSIEGFMETLVMQRLVKTKRYKKDRADEVLDQQLLLIDNNSKDKDKNLLDKFNFDVII